MWSAKQHGTETCRGLDPFRAKTKIVAHIRRRLKVKLAMVIAVIPDRVALARGPSNELRPPLGVPAENEERGLHAARGEGVEDGGGRVGIRPVVERQRDRAVRGAEPRRCAGRAGARYIT